VDPAVGISVDAKPGARVKTGDVLARVHVRNASDADAIAARVLGAFSIGDELRGAPPPLVCGRLPA
jgi:thymidine phosphorylase